MASLRPLVGSLRTAASRRLGVVGAVGAPSAGRITAMRARRPLSLAAAAPRIARCAFVPACSAPGARRWLNRNEKPIPESVDWSFEDVMKEVENPSEDVVIVDVREPHELRETGFIPKAINIPITSAVQSFHIADDLFSDMHGFEKPGKDKMLVFYCKAGIRAKSAAGLANHAGWKKTASYPGSWLDWEKRGGPVRKV